MNRQQLVSVVREHTHSLLRQKGYVSPVELFISMNRLTKKDYYDWRMRRIPYLERAIKLNLKQLSFAMRELRICARELNLKPSWTHYCAWGKGQKTTLRFSISKDPKIERHYATHFVKTK